ncbi:hypothetical protein P280DRAFT_542441 [Massarina eburnea CBS 473.64]|uniref:RING-type E3 ubiquitin transferase n=1 Tax=Massarina eburnea CBS 473.64 TaxID=1395130 RepID=A0A6A6S120_9PLEO|nr:hypothetical protein P280DRAFT_542441 [Massarina eburnea CBS 473.64]
MDPTAGSKDDTRDSCVICLHAVTERAIAAPCNHYTFDFICLVSWLQERSTCPLCKARKVEVSAVQYDFCSPTDYKTYAVRRTHRHSIHAPYGLPRRPRRFGRVCEQPIVDVSILRRRHVYRHKLYSYHVGSNPVSGYQDIYPHMVADSSDLQSKARMWIRRELRVFSFLYTDPSDSTPTQGGATTSSNAEFLLSYVVAILKKVDLKASNGHAENLLQEHLGRDNARLFLHELKAWMRSPYSKLRDWDGEVQYREELPEPLLHLTT